MSGRHVHHDFNFWNVNDMITTWIPLMPIPIPLGGLAILSGSQLGEPTDDHMLGVDEQNFATAEYEPGDVVLFHCLTAHGVLPNTQDTYRMSGDFRWQRKNEAVRERLLFGPDGRRFQRHAELFSDEPWWQPVPEDAVVIPHRTRSRVQPASALFEVNNAWNPSRVSAVQNAYAGSPRDGNGS